MNFTSCEQENTIKIRGNQIPPSVIQMLLACGESTEVLFTGFKGFNKTTNKTVQISNLRVILDLDKMN